MISTKWPTRITSIGAQSENNYIDLLKFEFSLHVPFKNYAREIFGKNEKKYKHTLIINQPQ